MYLHNDINKFKTSVQEVSNALNIDTGFIEKDYYITMILKEFAKQRNDIVFKGGTSLSKCYGIINRFSEDIDISFTEHIGESKRNKLKNQTIKSISETLNISIINGI